MLDLHSLVLEMGGQGGGEGKGGILGWLLWEDAGHFFDVLQSQFLVAPKTDVPLVKAGPIGNGDNTSVLRRKKTKRGCAVVILTREKQSENM